MGFFSFVSQCGMTGWLLLVLGLVGIAAAGLHAAKPADKWNGVLRSASIAMVFLTLTGIALRLVDGIVAMADRGATAGEPPFAVLTMPGVLNTWVLGFGLLAIAWVVFSVGELRRK